jgi:hypothetical protein
LFQLTSIPEVHHRDKQPRCKWYDGRRLVRHSPFHINDIVCSDYCRCHCHFILLTEIFGSSLDIDCRRRVFKIFRKFGSCIPTRKSKALETDDVAHPENVKSPEEDDAAKDTEEEEADEAEEEETSQKPDADDEASPSPAAAASKEDAPEDTPEAPFVEQRDGAGEDPAQAEHDETAREEDEATEKPEDEKPAQDGDEYQWEISCCGVDIPLSK